MRNVSLYGRAARLAVKPFTPEQTREIVFKTLLESEVDYTIQLDGTGSADYRSVVASSPASC
jgi:type III restriction enzyme